MLVSNLLFEHFLQCPRINQLNFEDLYFAPVNLSCLNYEQINFSSNFLLGQSPEQLEVNQQRIESLTFACKLQAIDELLTPHVGSLKEGQALSLLQTLKGNCYASAPNSDNVNQDSKVQVFSLCPHLSQREPCRNRRLANFIGLTLSCSFNAFLWICPHLGLILVLPCYRYVFAFNYSLKLNLRQMDNQLLKTIKEAD